MRSNKSRNRNLGIQNAQPSAKSIVRRDADRPSMFAMWCASLGYAWRLWAAMGEALQHPIAATRVGKTRVTAPALCAAALQRSGRHSSMCRLAAR